MLGNRRSKQLSHIDVAPNSFCIKTFPRINDISVLHAEIQGGPKTDTQFYFWDNFGNSAPISTILSLLQAEIYGA